MYDDGMKLIRTASGYVVEVPDDIVAALGLNDGDPVTVGKVNLGPVAGEIGWEAPADVFRRLARPLPPGYKFDREEANAR